MGKTRNQTLTELALAENERRRRAALYEEASGRVEALLRTVAHLQVSPMGDSLKVLAQLEAAVASVADAVVTHDVAVMRNDVRARAASLSLALSKQEAKRIGDLAKAESDLERAKVVLAKFNE